VTLSTEGSDKFVTSLAASIATGQSDHSQAGLAPAEIHTHTHGARSDWLTSEVVSRKLGANHTQNRKERQRHRGGFGHRRGGAAEIAAA
jgi:hypothetical protein